MAVTPSYLTLALALAACQAEVVQASLFSRYHHSRATFVLPSSSAVLNCQANNENENRSHHPLLGAHPSTHHFRPCNNKRQNIISLSLQEKDDSEASDTNNNQQLPNQSSFAKYGRPQDITADSFGPLLPIAEAVDEATGGWGLSYADLQPATPRTSVGQAFLATNFFYAAAGLWLGLKGDWFYGGLTELAGVVSFVYHYTQLEFGKNRSEVRLALLIDYFCAGAALITGGVYMIQAGITTIPMESMLAAGGAVVSLSLCWVWEFGYPYIFWHSVWHILSALTGFLVGQDHLSKIAG